MRDLLLEKGARQEKGRITEEIESFPIIFSFFHLPVIKDCTDANYTKNIKRLLVQSQRRKLEEGFAF